MGGLGVCRYAPGAFVRRSLTIKHNFSLVGRVTQLTGIVRNFSTSPYSQNKVNAKKSKITENAQKFINDTRVNSSNALKQSTDKLRENTKNMKNMTNDIKLKTIQRSKDFRNNMKKIIPPEIHENVYTVPNILTFTRLISAPVVGYLILHGEVKLALILFTYSCVTDFLDGFIARHWNLKSIIGSVIDPLADKMLMIICTVCLATTSEIPLYLATIIIGRDVLLGISAFIIRYLSLPKPKTFWRYWDFSIPSASVHPTTISKVNTALQMLYLGTMMIKPVLVMYLSNKVGGVEISDIFLEYVKYLEYTVATTTLWSGLSYVFSKNAVKFVRR